MAAKSSRTSPRHLLIDVVREILFRLPSKSLLRFRCVCKTWRDLITDPKFVESHRNQNNNGHIFVAGREIFSLHCEKTFVEHTRFNLPPHNFRVLGCSNALICFTRIEFDSDSDSEIYQWNPSIRKLKLLPHSPSHAYWNYRTRVEFAFAFVPQTNDYRVLKIVYRYGNREVKTEIYSLSTNSWKMVENEIHCQLIDNQFARVVNGVVHFMATDLDTKNDIILSFNMVNEVFRKIMIPEAFNEYTLLYPMAFGELLLVIAVEPFTGSDMVNIWVMNEYGCAVGSWTQKSNFDYCIQPLGFLKNGDLVCFYGNRLSSYDPILSEIKDLQCNGVPRTLNAVTYYMESLVLLNEGN